VAPPFRQAEFDIIYDRGISREGDILELGVKHGMIEKSGAYFSYGEEKLGQGKEKAREYLEANRATCAKIEKEITSAILS
jgi:recombination protein RecA